MEIKAFWHIDVWATSINGGDFSQTEELHMAPLPGDAYIQTQLGAFSTKGGGGADVWISFVWDADGQFGFHTGSPTDRPHAYWAKGCQWVEITLETSNAYAYGTCLLLIF